MKCGNGDVTALTSECLAEPLQGGEDLGSQQRVVLLGEKQAFVVRTELVGREVWQSRQASQKDLSELGGVRGTGGPPAVGPQQGSQAAAPEEGLCDGDQAVQSSTGTGNGETFTVK